MKHSEQIWKKKLNHIINRQKKLKTRSNLWLNFFLKKNIFSKNTIPNNKLIIDIIQSNPFKTKRHKTWNFMFNTKKNINGNIKNTNVSVKVKHNEKWYYLSINEYVMYKNKKQHVNLFKKNFKIKIENESLKKSLCWKPQKSEISKNFEKIRQIIHETIDKKNSSRFVRKKSADFSSIKKKFSKFENKEKYFVHGTL